jgi:fructose-bisphosphate aldolase class II
VSEGEREFIGVKQAAALIKSLRDTYDYPIFLNADHTHSLDKAKEAAEAGFDEIIFDNSSLPMDQNIANTKAAVAAIRAINPEIVIEGEIGYIGSSSEIIAARPEASLTMSTPEEAATFVRETGIDVLAPAVGNMHGLLKSMTTGGADAEHKHLDIQRIADIKAAIAGVGGRFMTLHGGSGTEDRDFTAAARAGMTIIHVSSELRLAWRRGVEEGLKDPNEIAPYKLVAPAVAAIQKIVEDRLRLFNGLA